MLPFTALEASDLKTKIKDTKYFFALCGSQYFLYKEMILHHSKYKEMILHHSKYKTLLELQADNGNAFLQTHLHEASHRTLATTQRLTSYMQQEAGYSPNWQSRWSTVLSLKYQVMSPQTSWPHTSSCICRQWLNVKIWLPKKAFHETPVYLLTKCSHHCWDPDPTSWPSMNWSPLPSAKVKVRDTMAVTPCPGAWQAFNQPINQSINFL